SQRIDRRRRHRLLQVPVGQIVCVHRTATMTELAGWGRYPRHETCVIAVSERSDVPQTIVAREGLIARGNGRSYGDSSIGRAVTFDLRRLNRFIDFDATTGVLTCEAGILLSDVINIFTPRGWFPAVTPGTKFVTIGGMI